MCQMFMGPIDVVSIKVASRANYDTFYDYNGQIQKMFAEMEDFVTLTPVHNLILCEHCDYSAFPR